MAGIEDIFYLDKVDFYYTVSAPLTRADLGPRLDAREGRPARPRDAAGRDHDDGPGADARASTATTSMRRGSRSRRTRRPPTRTRSPTSSRSRSSSTRGRPSGSSATTSRSRRRGRPARRSPPKVEPTDDMFGVWMGTQSAAHGGLPWWHILVGRRAPVPEPGLRALPDARPTSTSSSRATAFTQIDSRVPFDPAATDTTAMFQGASVPGPGRAAARHGALPDDRPLRRRRRRAVPRDGARAGREEAPREGAGRAVAAGRLDGHRQRRPRRRRRQQAETATFTVTPPAVGDGRPRTSSARRSPREAGQRHDRHRRPRRARRAGPGAAAAAGRRSSSSGRATSACRSSAAASSRCCRSASARRARCASTCATGAAPTQSGTRHADAAGRLLAPTPASQPYSGLAAGGASSVTFQVTNTNTVAAHVQPGRRRHGDYDTQVTTTSGAGVEHETFGAGARPVDGDPAGGGRPGRERRRGRGRVPGPDARREPRVGGRRVHLGRGLLGHGEDRLARRRPLRRRPRHRRRARHEGDARRLQAPLAHRLGGDHARPARHRGEHLHDVQDGHLPDDDRGHAVLRARRRQPPGRREHRARDAGRVGRVVALHRLHGRGEDPARRPARGGRPAAPRAEHPRLRLRHAGPDRPDAARLVDRTAACRATRTAGATRPCPATRRRPAGRRRRRPGDRRTTAALSVDSPQSILQSATDGVPLAGGPEAEDGLTRGAKPTLGACRSRSSSRRRSPARHVFAWTGTKSAPTRS